jgi:RNA polymerase sigma-70 factor, ECF subfamily
VEHLNDKKFVRKLKAGDAEAFRTLYLALAPKIVSFLIRTRSMNAPDAEEVTDDAFLKVYKAIATFDPSRSAKLTTWVFEIAKNAGIDHYRKVKSREGVDAEPSEEASGEFVGGPRKQPNEPTTDPVGIGYEAERTSPGRDSTARRAYDTLNEKEKDILRIRDIMSYEEIAKIEGTTANAVSTRYSRALQKLKAAYEKEKENER